MPRVTDTDVLGLFPGRSLVVAPFILTADAIVDDLVTNAGSNSLTAERLAKITLYLAGHFVQLTNQDGALAAQTVGEATERYHNIYGQGLKNTSYGQQAILLDTTGYLAQLSSLAENTSQRPAEFRVI